MIKKEKTLLIPLFIKLPWIQEKEYKDGWREDLAVESTRPMD